MILFGLRMSTIVLRKLWINIRVLQLHSKRPDVMGMMSAGLMHAHYPTETLVTIWKAKVLRTVDDLTKYYKLFE